MSEAPAVFTPAEVAARVGASPTYIKRLAREKRVAHLRVGRNAIKFTEAQAAAVVEYLTELPEAPVAESLTTPRSRARRSA